MFKPLQAVIEKNALDYERGRQILNELKRDNIEVKIVNNRITGASGKTQQEMFFQGKNTLVVGVRKQAEFQTCKPSAHYMLPIASGCAGMCEYCYLNTQLGKRPYVKVYVNLEEILDKADQYIKDREPQITIFEGAATADPLPVERYGHGLASAIEHFGQSELGYFRFVTKFDDIEPVLGLNHNGHTEIRFSLNTDTVIKKYEHKVPAADERIQAAVKAANAGYPLGFIIAPVFLYDNWREDYGKLISDLSTNFKDKKPGFEVISHRYTSRAKEQILTTFPQTTLPMDESQRKLKYGQFGYSKYVYNNEDINQIKEFFADNIGRSFGSESIKYII